MNAPPGARENRSRSALELITPFTVLLLFLALGEAAKHFLGTWIPGSVLGMLALSAALWTGLVKVGILERTSELLLANLGLFFICPGVEIINFLGLIEEHWLSLCVAVMGSSLATLLATGAVSRVLHPSSGRSDA